MNYDWFITQEEIDQQLHLDRVNSSLEKGVNMATAVERELAQDVAGLVHREEITGENAIRHLKIHLEWLLEMLPKNKRMVCKVFWEDDLNPREAD